MRDNGQSLPSEVSGSDELSNNRVPIGFPKTLGPKKGQNH